MEKKLRKTINKLCTIEENNPAYVVTGTIPGERLLNEKVNIPSVFWTAFCCTNKKNQNELISRGYKMEMTWDGNGEVVTYGKTRENETFAQLNNYLGQKYCHSLHNGLFQVFGDVSGCK